MEQIISIIVEKVLFIVPYVLTALGVMVLFCLAVMVHEFGHFLAAKLLGFKVDAFSIGFGPAIWKKKINGCEYRLSWLPLGGYVALPQLDPSSMDTIQGSHTSEGETGNKEKGEAEKTSVTTEAESVPPQPPWKRIVVAVAGPLGNIILAIIIAFIIGTFAPDSQFGGHRTVVGSIRSESAAERSGLQVGDTILQINGTPVSFWTEVVIECHLAGSTNRGVQALIQPADATKPQRTITLPITQKEQADTTYFLLDGIRPFEQTVVFEVRKDSPAEKAGLKTKDTILAVAETKPNNPEEAIQAIAATSSEPFTMVVRREGVAEPIALTLAAVWDEELKRPIIGATLGDPAIRIPQWMMHKQPSKQLSADAKGIFRILRALFVPKNHGEAGRAAKGMGGPGSLLFMLWNEVQSGFFHSIAFLRFLCINLAILNLLPLPVLDGGHILFAFIEMITRRRPSQKLVNTVTNFFAILLIGLMVFMLFRDAIRIVDFVKH